MYTRGMTTESRLPSTEYGIDLYARWPGYWLVVGWIPQWLGYCEHRYEYTQRWGRDAPLPLCSLWDGRGGLINPGSSMKVYLDERRLSERGRNLAHVALWGLCEKQFITLKRSTFLGEYAIALRPSSAQLREHGDCHVARRHGRMRFRQRHGA